VNESGIPFDDASGDRLREWLGVSRAVFLRSETGRDPADGFLFSGTGKSGDLPPRAECAPAWREHWPTVIPLPHPSPRNNIWLRKNPWLERELLPQLKSRVAEVLK